MIFATLRANQSFEASTAGAVLVDGARARGAAKMAARRAGGDGADRRQPLARGSSTAAPRELADP